MARFDDDFPIEAVRGCRVPSNNQVLRQLTRRAAWLQRKVEKETRISGKMVNGGHPVMLELTAIAVAIMAVEKGRGNG